MPFAGPGVGLPVNIHNVLTKWQFGVFPVIVLATLIAIAVWYLRADWALAKRGRRWSMRRTAAFMSGLVAVDLALQSSLAGYVGTYFQAHIIQHLFLMVLAPPLLALGAPMTLALQTTSRRTKGILLRILHSQVFAVLTYPVVVWFLYYGVMFGFFLTPILNYAMNHMAVMDLINVGFLGGATLFWWPLVALDPIPRWSMGYGAKMINLIIGVPIESFLGIALLNDHNAAASMYTVAGTHAGGGLLWVGAEFFSVMALVPIFFQWMRSEDRVAAREDARLDAEAAAQNLPAWVAPQTGSEPGFGRS